MWQGTEASNYSHVSESSQKSKDLILFTFHCVGSSLQHRAFSSCVKRGLFIIVVHGLLLAVVSLVVEYGL